MKIWRPEEEFDVPLIFEDEEDQEQEEDFATQLQPTDWTDDMSGEEGRDYIDDQYGEGYRDYLPQIQSEEKKGTLFLIALTMFGLCAAFFLVSAAHNVDENNVLAAQINNISFAMPVVEGPPKPTGVPEDALPESIQLEMPASDIPDSIAKRIKAKEEKQKTSTLHEENYKIYTDAASHFLIEDQLEKYFGTLYCDDWDMQVDLAYTNSQDALDAAGSACVLTPAIKNLPGIGEKSGAAVILDYNYQEFSALQYAKKGDRLYIKTVYGEFLYEVTKCQLGMAAKDGQSIILDNNDNLMEYCTSGKFNGVVLCTNYPFDSREDTGYRYVVFAKLVDGTSMTL